MAELLHNEPAQCKLFRITDYHVDLKASSLNWNEE